MAGSVPTAALPQRRLPWPRANGTGSVALVAQRHCMGHRSQPQHHCNNNTARAATPAIAAARPGPGLGQGHGLGQPLHGGAARAMAGVAGWQGTAMLAHAGLCALAAPGPPLHAVLNCFRIARTKHLQARPARGCIGLNAEHRRWRWGGHANLIVVLQQARTAAHSTRLHIEASKHVQHPLTAESLP